jgi:predicted acetylornithine/succinylornithine family transaminase
MQSGTERFAAAFMPTYAPFGKVLARGEGSWLYDTEGGRYLDFCGGIAVSNLGHCHPAVVEAIREQAGRLMHVSNLYLHEVELHLAEMLLGLTMPGRLFLCQSGAEANETAIKLARKHARVVRGQERPWIVTALNSFHGRTMGALSATGQAKYHAGFEPLLPGFRYVPFGDLVALDAAVGPDTCAVMLEPIQAEGGIVLPPSGYLEAVRHLCDERGAILIFDEVQTGFGRTGSLFAWQGERVAPDIFTMAKAMGGGLPLGGAIAAPAVAAAFAPGAHATTFGGNPVSCAAALAVLRVMQQEDLPGRAREWGARLSASLAGLRQAHPGLVTDVRGRGLLIGMELSRGARDVQARCQENGLLLSVVQDRVLRFTPPLTVTRSEIETALGILGPILADEASRTDG